MLEEYAGYWALWSPVVFGAEVLALLWLFWKRTGMAFFNRWLWRLSWILPCCLYLAYRNHGPVPDFRTIRSFEDYLHFQTVLAVRNAEILAARYIPYLAAAIVALTLLPSLIAKITHLIKDLPRRVLKPAARL